MQRINYNPGDDELLELILSNSLNRNQNIADMLCLLMNIDKGLSIFLDGDWESGKAHFVRSRIIVINKHIEKRRSTGTGFASGVLSSLKTPRTPSNYGSICSSAYSQNSS